MRFGSERRSRHVSRGTPREFAGPAAARFDLLPPGRSVQFPGRPLGDPDSESSCVWTSSAGRRRRTSAEPVPRNAGGRPGGARGTPGWDERNDVNRIRVGAAPD
jgi:hypothetical protein